MILFQLGEVYATPSALEAIQDANKKPIHFLRRHVRGDWGDLGEDDKNENACSVRSGARIFSSYNLPSGLKLWVITEAVNDQGERASTCLLLPFEY